MFGHKRIGFCCAKCHNQNLYYGTDKRTERYVTNKTT